MGGARAAIGDFESASAGAAAETVAMRTGKTGLSDTGLDSEAAGGLREPGPRHLRGSCHGAVTPRDLSLGVTLVEPGSVPRRRG